MIKFFCEFFQISSRTITQQIQHWAQKGNTVAELCRSKVYFESSCLIISNFLVRKIVLICELIQRSHYWWKWSRNFLKKMSPDTCRVVLYTDMFYQVVKYLSRYICTNSAENSILTVSNWIISPVSASWGEPVSASRHLSGLPDLHHDIPNTNLSQALINYTDDVYDLGEASVLSSHILAVFICQECHQHLSDGWWSSDSDVMTIIITFSPLHQDQQNKILTIFKPFHSYIQKLSSLAPISKQWNMNRF